jgi:hypothetical protein
MQKFIFLSLVLLGLLTTHQSFAQKTRPEATVQPMESKLFDSFEFRSIRTAFMSGRITNTAIDPTGICSDIYGSLVG